MLPWSKAYSFRLVFIAVIASSGLGFLCGGTPLGAQEQPTEAVLLSGPTPVKGIPVYTPNDIPASRGVYSLKRGQDGGAEEEGTATGEARNLTVLYSSQDLLILQSWISSRCGAWRVFKIPGQDSFSVCYRDERGFFLFFFFPEAREPAYWCGFIDPFINRFSFLLNFLSREADAPFPAILQLGQ